MKVAAWIESLNRFAPDLEVLVRIENYDSGDEMIAAYPVFAMSVGCNDEEYLGIKFMDEDSGIEG